jgi:hypothetical protein
MSKVKEIRKFSILRAEKVPSLDTFEQVVHGAGSRSVQSLKKQALKIKYRNRLISTLIDYAVEVGSPNIAQYRSILKCSTTLEQTKNIHLTPTHRCGARLCSICSNIRTGKTMNELEPLFDMNKDWSYLVLTRKNSDLRNISPEDLRSVVDDMYIQISKIRQRAKRKFGEVDAIITLEVEQETYKRKKTGGIYWGYYNPHFNIIGQHKHLEYIKEEWQKIIICREENQRLQRIEKDKMKSSLLELLKYTMKGITNYKKESFINLRAVDTITTALKGKRRLITWGCFYNKKIEEIQDMSVDSLELTKYIYNDIPVKDTGDLVKLVDRNGDVRTTVSEFVKSIYWVYDYRMCNYYYIDDWANKHWLLNWKKIPEEPKVFFTIDMKQFIEKNKCYEKM